MFIYFYTYRPPVQLPPSSRFMWETLGMNRDLSAVQISSSHLIKKTKVSESWPPNVKNVETRIKYFQVIKYFLMDTYINQTHIHAIILPQRPHKIGVWKNSESSQIQLCSLLVLVLQSDGVKGRAGRRPSQRLWPSLESWKSAPCGFDSPSQFTHPNSTQQSSCQFVVRDLPRRPGSGPLSLLIAAPPLLPPSFFLFLQKSRIFECFCRLQQVFIW